MVASLEAIRELEQERKRAVDELHRLQRVVARHDEQDKEAAKAAEQRWLDVSAQIERLEKEKKELAENVGLILSHCTILLACMCCLLASACVRMRPKTRLGAALLVCYF